MNTISSKSIRPAGKRLSLGIITLFTAATVAASAATEDAELNLRGKQFGHGKDLIVNSGNWQIKPSKFYHYSITGTVRGRGGDLGKMFNAPIPLDGFFDVLKPGSFELLTGVLPNPSGTLSDEPRLFSQKIGGTRNIDGRIIKLQATFAASIAANGQLLIQITGVSAMKKEGGKLVPLTGTMKFGKRTKLKVSTAPIVQFLSSGQPEFAEGVGNASVVIVRKGSLNLPASATYTTVNDTATGGVDYTATEGTVDFAPGEKRKTIMIPILNDTVKEPYRRFNIVLSNPSDGAVLGDPISNRVVIKDDD